MVRQNPSVPDVILPEGWSYHFWSTAGFGTGAILGPHGEEIVFPGYGGSGALAATTQETSPDAVSINATLDDQRVDVSVRPDGYLAVSYPLGRMDFWTQTKSAREAAIALTIALSRIDFQNEKHPHRLKAQLLVKLATADFPFQNMSVGTLFIYEPQTTEFRFRGKADQSVKVQKEIPAGSKWQERRMLLGHELRWGENRAGSRWATYGDGAPAFVSSIADSRGICLAIMLAMTYTAGAKK